MRGAGSSLRDFGVASKASQGAGSSACAVGLRRRVGEVAKFSSTDRAPLRKLGVPWRRASWVLAPVSLRDLTPRLVASVAPPLGTRHRVRGKAAKPARLGQGGSCAGVENTCGRSPCAVRRAASIRHHCAHLRCATAQVCALCFTGVALLELLTENGPAQAAALTVRPSHWDRGVARSVF